MLKLYSTDNRKFLKQVNKSEAELNRFIKYSLSLDNDPSKLS
jgi:hypothetical protein